MENSRKLLIGLVLGCILGLGGLTWFNGQIKEMPPGAEFLVRWDAMPFDRAVAILEERGVVRNAWVFSRYARLERKAVAVQGGTYAFRPGMSMAQIVQSLKTPLRQNVRIPEGWWIKRVAERLESKNVCTAKEYEELAAQPQAFQDSVDFPLPKGSLEGYLYPDTYDLPPMMGARAVILRQLQTFKKKVVDKVGEEGLARAVVLGSMVELEVAKDDERPRVAGVIENRIKKGMRLQIDATVLYALGEWKELGPGVVNTVQSPYNTYLHAGLPPGPIGSPSIKSIEAALKPEAHNYLFYVARPDRSHYFTSDYGSHLKAIAKARGEWRTAKEPDNL
ncbi:MAG: endolytic transglycosylase MltG [Armatimonadetes bacterium]|nr:endolytic transglycosylase MltG [Armatimonadota bacterium]